MVTDRYGKELKVGQKVCYASGTRSWVTNHIGTVNRVGNKIAFLIGKEGYEIPMRGNDNRIVILDDIT